MGEVNVASAATVVSIMREDSVRIVSVAFDLM